MVAKRSPRLRTVEKYKPPYPLNKFPSDFPLRLGKEIIFSLATRRTPRIEGSDWEEIFARIIDAKWKPSNVGLDDIVLQQTAWGAKTVKNPKPASVKKIRLISGRNSPVYSYGDQKVTERDENELGEKILEIWNERVSGVKKQFKHLRTIVLIKGEGLQEVSVFEFETVRYLPNDYWWQWNDRKNLEGYSTKTDEHMFTWQPHGSQFTIIEDVPEKRLAIRVKKPPIVDSAKVLESIKFDNSWVEVISKP